MQLNTNTITCRLFDWALLFLAGHLAMGENNLEKKSTSTV